MSKLGAFGLAKHPFTYADSPILLFKGRFGTANICILNEVDRFRLGADYLHYGVYLK